jgi:hypothetical protein
VLIDDIAVVDAAGRRTLVEGFEQAGPWRTFPARTVQQDTISLVGERAHSGTVAAQFTFRPGNSADLRGFMPATPGVPLPAVVSESFLAATGLAKGGGILMQFGDALVPVVVVDTYRFFATLPAAEGPSIIVGRDQLAAWARAATLTSAKELDPREVWLSLGPGADRKQLAAVLSASPISLGVVRDREASLAAVTGNPLIAASGSGVLTVAYLGVLVLVAAALLVSLWWAVQRRRVEFAVLHALGWSGRQVLGLLALGYFLVALVGVGAGAIVGRLVGARMLSFLNATEDGSPIEPDFVLRTEWWLVGIGAGVVLAVFAAGVVLAARVVGRVASAQALRAE